MFGLFKFSRQPDPLSTAKQKLYDLVSLHLKTLAIKRQAGISLDAYGTPNSAKWGKEVQYFMDGVLAPTLTAAEKKAILEAGLNSVAQEFVEDRVRAECSRMHATGERNMTIQVVHPPDTATARPRASSRAIISRNLDRANQNISRGLIIREEPLERILSGNKTWEMRSNHTKIRGRIGLVKKGSKAVFGTAEIIESKGPLSDTELLETVHYHGISPSRIKSGEVSNYRYAWVLSNVKRLTHPVPYLHKGGVIFVTLDEYAIQELSE